MRLPALAAAAVALTAAVAAHAAPPAAPAKAPSKMGGCAAQWKAMSAADKAKYDTRAKGMKSKKGNGLSGYNVWTGECMKK